MLQTGFGGVPGLQWNGFIVVPAAGDFAGTQEDGTKVKMPTLCHTNAHMHIQLTAPNSKASAESLQSCCIS